MNKFMRNLNFFLAGLLIIATLAFCTNVGATNVEAVANSGNHASGNNKSFAIGGSDADIAGCRFTEGGLTIQWTRKDKFCQALRLIDSGFVDTGVLAICTKTWIGDLYSDLSGCQDAMKQKYAPVVVAEPEIIEDDDEDEWREEQVAMQIDYDSRIAQLEKRLSRPPPKIIERTTVEQRPLLTKEMADSLRVEK